MTLTREFWEKAYRENAPKILGICRRYVSDHAVAEDLMHDSFLIALSKSESYSGKGSFEAWLRKIAVNNALMYLRRNNIKRINIDLMLDDNMDQTMDEPNAESIRNVIEQAEFSTMELLEVIDHLPEHHRLVFNLYVIDNYSHAQISKELNISPGTSKSHLARARKKIQLLLYQKALMKPLEQKKRKRAAFALFLSCKSTYIDRIFKGKMSDFSIEPIKERGSFPDTVNWDNVAIPVSGTSFFSSRLIYWITAASLAILILIGIYYGKNDISSRAVPVLDPITNDKSDIQVRHSDSLHHIGLPNPVRIKGVPGTESMKRQPLVIKKTIIHRRIITIRDTIKIIDSTNAE
jgi:RNA polymerase sigma factor (sigma-70 family)